VKKMGDGILAVFKHPLNAVIASLAVQSEVTRYNAMRLEQEKFQVRIGLNTGPVIRKDNDVFGEVVNVASRMQSTAAAGEIQISQSTFDEVKDYVRCTELGRIQVKGIKDGIVAYSPQEVTVDLSRFRADGAAAKAGPEATGASMEKLKESLFVPTFHVPEEMAGKRPLAGFLRDVFTEISRAVEDLASDYREEYVFKEYLQRKWNDLLGKL
jgi:hypothetical protein